MRKTSLWPMARLPGTISVPGRRWHGISNQDAEGNCVVADFIHVDAARNIIFDARTKNRTPIAVVGLRDSILVQTDDAVLLAHKSQAQKVKELVRKLGDDARFKKLI
jgi:hypothetical protein